jgi:hypothetical protein
MDFARQASGLIFPKVAEAQTQLLASYSVSKGTSVLGGLEWCGTNVPGACSVFRCVLGRLLVGLLDRL